MLLFPQTPLGGGVGRPHIEPTREEVHRFDSRIIQVLLASRDKAIKAGTRQERQGRGDGRDDLKPGQAAMAGCQ